ncbi:GNAT family N-acetyltransferase [Streptomyces sp. NPDC006475]|uniref:GNAT family N-acetyltransferase n=1 Tax=Streptomyces sp. NPDC006475 TaxID=3155719 RepID=UPI0033B51B03
MRIRLVQVDELPLLQEIERAADDSFREIGMSDFAEGDVLPLDELVRYHQAGMAWAAVDDEDVPVAFLTADHVDGNLHIEQVSVHPGSARRGIGRMLLEHAAEQAMIAEIPALTLNTCTEVPWNAPYYTRCGFLPMADDELTPGLRELREKEAVRGLDRWPRTCMRRPV